MTAGGRISIIFILDNNWLSEYNNRAARFGDIAQLGERCVRNAEVTGSNPAISTKENRKVRFDLILAVFFFLYIVWGPSAMAGPRSASPFS